MNDSESSLRSAGSTPVASPRPWRVYWGEEFWRDLRGGESEHGRVYGIRDANDERIVETDTGVYPPCPADAELIVRAVNEYDVLKTIAVAASDLLNTMTATRIPRSNHPLMRLATALAAYERGPAARSPEGDDAARS